MPCSVFGGRSPSRPSSRGPSRRDASRRNPSLRGVVLVAFVLVAALARLLPHPPNLTPVGALALFGGAAFASRRAALLLPLAAMLLSDVARELTGQVGFHGLLPVVYGCFALSVVMGRHLRGRQTFGGVAGASLASAVLFFVVTNAAVWAGGGLYPRTPAGFEACFVAALPFFGNSLAGYALYVPLLFGGLALLERRFPALARSTALLPAAARARVHPGDRDC